MGWGEFVLAILAIWALWSIACSLGDIADALIRLSADDDF